jgi:1,4-dihydroxy-2-naphthoate octaprenyltransferase
MTRCLIWLAAARPATLPVALAPVAVGSACAARYGGFRLGVACAAAAGALLIQIGTNFANDLGDYRRGADAADRIGPRRAVAGGLISPDAMRLATALAFFAAGMVGIYLVAVGGWAIAVVGVASIAAGLAYTAGPYPLAYLGLGDPFVFLFFGLVAVCGTAYVQLGHVPELAFWASVPIGALATAVLVVNNARDIESDARAKKRTLAVRMGAPFARLEYASLLASALVLLPFLVASGRASAWALLPLAAAPEALRLGRVVGRESGGRLGTALGGTARFLLAYAALFSLGLLG